jgi:hypothetical protein
MTSVLRTRRSLLAAGLGGLVATVAHAIGRPAPARAGTDGDVVLAGTNEELFSTTINNTNNNGGPALRLRSNEYSTVGTLYAINENGGYTITAYADGPLAAVLGSNSGGGHAVDGWGWEGTGVRGWSRTSGNQTGVYGISGESSAPAPMVRTGVLGYANQAADARGVWGRTVQGVGVEGDSESNYGVIGKSTTGIGVAGRGGDAQPSVYGVNAHASGYGVRGKNEASGTNGYLGGTYGVLGIATGSRGVSGHATGGIGVRGFATTGKAGSFVTNSGIALHASGPVQLETSSGSAVIAAGTRSKTVTPGFDLTTNSKILVTLMGNPGGTTVVQRVAVNATANTFTVYLNANAANNTKFAWLVLV